MVAKCVLCRKELELFDEEHFQPFEGGEIQLIFSYGSKFDEYPMAKYRGFICDVCSEKLIPLMVKETNV